MSLPTLLWKPSPNFSQRTARVDLLVLHDCQGGYGASVNWFLRKESQVSAHFVCREDGGEVTQMVELADKAWHACAFNSRSVGWEMAGYAAKDFSDALLETTAEAFAYLCHHLQIPVRHARGGVGPGIESHWGLGRAGGGHSDPSRDPSFMDTFIARVATHSGRGDFPVLWEPEKPGKPCLLNAVVDPSTQAA
jgi:N-acetylmuramoyl-L-alanine amidase